MPPPQRSLPREESSHAARVIPLSPSSGTKHAVSGEIRQAVADEVAAQLAIYRKIAIAFLVGLGGFFSLAFIGVLSMDAVKRTLRNDILGFSEEISTMSTRLDHTETKMTSLFMDELQRTVAFTYADQFALAFGDGQQSQYAIPFLVTKNWKVSAFLSIFHYGTKAKLKIGVSLNCLQEILQGTQDQELGIIPLTDRLAEARKQPGPYSHRDLHVIEFTVEAPSEPTDDTVFVTLLLNVSGPGELNE